MVKQYSASLAWTRTWDPSSSGGVPNSVWVKLCFNGYEYLMRQLAKEGIAYEEMANEILPLLLTVVLIVSDHGLDQSCS